MVNYKFNLIKNKLNRQYKLVTCFQIYLLFYITVHHVNEQMLMPFDQKDFK